MRTTFAILLLTFIALALTSGLAAAPLDLGNPTDAVKAMRKLQCHLEDGKPAIYWWTGSTYSRVPGEKDRRLFDYEGMNIRACQTVMDPEKGYGYRMVSKEVLFYLDTETGEIVRKWTNPWTGQELEVVHIANDPVNRWEDLPKVLRDEVAKNYPGFDSPPPVDDTRPNETSWTYFKKWVDGKSEEP